MPERPLIPAALYLRMSTEHQKYSILNQKLVIGDFAKRNGFNVVKAYADEGKSGVLLKRRTGLKQLLADVVGGCPPFKAILVYDVSRWGRFQNCDESAHYEFLCANAGVQVQYCAEPFPNDGSPQSALLKAVKRSMAAEYSRELGVRVFQGQKTLVQMGYKMGGNCLYGLRRQLVSLDGTVKFILKPGEAKSLSTDHVVQVRGPESEVRMVRRLYRMARTMSSVSILKKLNKEHRKFSDGRPWTLNRINSVLGNIRYTGSNMWGRVSTRLYSGKKKNPQEEWAFGPPTFKPIVSRAYFDKIQELRRTRDPRVTKIANEELLASVRVALKRDGRLSTKLFKRRRISVTLLRKRFGSLRQLYRQIGYQPTPRVLKQVIGGLLTRDKRSRVIATLLHMFGDSIQFERKGPRYRGTLLVDGHIPVNVETAICQRTITGLRWTFVKSKYEDRRSISLICRSNSENTDYDRYYLMRRLGSPRTCTFREQAWFLKQSIPLDSLSDFLTGVRSLYSETDLSRALSRARQRELPFA